eukprot:TRINITY_DN5015_c0_g1_i2.p3 TRINITY_DN5015_c0_g1~~TRINITY_DN5015_c0_g1_i2.p3  ORF type:complete len:107 (-),score=3.88 TRINITY_DN5015_c0_g1_i2:880-1200(-)
MGMGRDVQTDLGESEGLASKIRVPRARYPDDLNVNRRTETMKRDDMLTSRHEYAIKHLRATLPAEGPRSLWNEPFPQKSDGSRPRKTAMHGTRAGSSSRRQAEGRS